MGSKSCTTDIKQLLRFVFFDDSGASGESKLTGRADLDPSDACHCLWRMTSLLVTEHFTCYSHVSHTTAYLQDIYELKKQTQ